MDGEGCKPHDASDNKPKRSKTFTAKHLLRLLVLAILSAAVAIFLWIPWLWSLPGMACWGYSKLPMATQGILTNA